ncbi:MAG: flippase-like domain-containing protein, partial [Deltaproteobacteria bacterium]|nr:flippase-like domain-containing protein [Deltaproteobacteria bacterium]
LSVAGALPTGQAGEVAKANMLRGHSSSTAILSSLLVYNYLHVATTLVMVLAGPIVALFTGGFEQNVILTTLAVCIAVIVVTALLGALLYWGALHRLLERAAGWRFVPWTPSGKLKDGLREVDTKLRDIINNRPADVARATVGLLVGRLFQVAEVYAILVYMGVSDSVGVAMMVFSTTAMANYLLMVLPAREGFLEGSTFVVFEMLGLSGAEGLSLEITRRLRKIVYQLVGIVLMMVFVGRKDEREKS